MWRRDAFLRASKRAKELRASGCTLSQIAERLGVKDPYNLLRQERTEPSGTLASLQAEAIEKQPDAPVILCQTDSADFLRFYCPHCKAVHYHQHLVDGWRKAKCWRGPYRATGYRLVVGA
jgi:hypothetical protein